MKTPDIGVSDGTGKDVNDTGAMGIVMGPVTYRSQHGVSKSTSKRELAERSVSRTRATRSYEPQTSSSASTKRVKSATVKGQVKPCRGDGG